jgi:hypothetical protein
MKEAMMGIYAAHTIEWSSFGCTTHTQGDGGLSSNDDTTLPDGDQICVIEEDGARYQVAPYELRVVLQTSSNVTTWKELKAVTKDGETYLSVATDQPGPKTMLLQVREGKVWYSFARTMYDPFKISTALVFRKVTAAGLRTAIYELHGLEEKAGKRITFRWESD